MGWMVAAVRGLARGAVSRSRLRLRVVRAVALGIALATVAMPAWSQARGDRAVMHFRGISQRSRPARPSHVRVVVILRDQVRGMHALSVRARVSDAAVRAPVAAQMRWAGARGLKTTNLLNTITATVTPAEEARLRRDPAVERVVPDSLIHVANTPALDAPTSPPVTHRSADAVAPGEQSGPLCGTSSAPEQDPEALSQIDATNVGSGGDNGLGEDGAGVTVAFLADGIGTDVPDLQRNAQFASAGSPAGSSVVTDDEDFTGDGQGADQSGDEAYLDAASIAAQANTPYDLSQYTPAGNLPSGCDITIQGDAPGADLMALNVFAGPDSGNGTYLLSSFLQAIDYAVAHGANVINESLGFNEGVQSALDAITAANDAAQAAGVVVVVSSADAGITNTISSPADDPSVISVGATTTFRAYEQDARAGTNVPGASGNWVDGNISSLSSGGFTDTGNTVNLVAPGDANWTLSPSGGVMLDEGTSESTPLVAGAAADVIEAYTAYHNGTAPSPAEVKDILTSTADDIDAPAVQQGAGILDVAAAIRMAESVGGAFGSQDGGIQVSPGQINVTQDPHQTSPQTLTLTNTGTQPTTVKLSTRSITAQIADTTGSFCMQPGTATADCPANTGTFLYQPGDPQVYESETFSVPANAAVTRLDFTAAYPAGSEPSTAQVALFTPDGAFAGYSVQQGGGGYDDVQVANPAPGTWRAVIFTNENSGMQLPGVQGTVRWQARVLKAISGDKVAPSHLTLGPGQTSTAQVSVVSPATPGDTAQSVVVSTPGSTSTVPVTVRTLIPIGAGGGHFAGTLLGGNGRFNSPAQTNSYSFDVPAGEPALHATVSVGDDGGDEAVGYLVDPDGQTEAYSTNDTTGNPATNTIRTLNLYHVAPMAGQWRLILYWIAPVSSNQLQEPFTGTVAFSAPRVTSTLPHSGSVELSDGVPYTFTVRIPNGSSPEEYFADPRLATTQTLTLSDQNDAQSSLTLPFPSVYPQYIVPTNTTQLDAQLSSPDPDTFVLEYGSPYLDYEDDSTPLLSPEAPTSSTSGTDGTTATLSFQEPEVAPGIWTLNPSLIGPYPPHPQSVTAQASATVQTQAFDPTVTSSTGDLWSSANLGGSFSPLQLVPHQTGTITVTITPNGSSGTQESGTLYVDDDAFSPQLTPGGDEVAAIPYSYTIK